VCDFDTAEGSLSTIARRTTETQLELFCGSGKAATGLTRLSLTKPLFLSGLQSEALRRLPQKRRRRLLASALEGS